MALTLPPALLAAQSAAVRQPVIELKAGSFDESIPFIGRQLDEYTDIEKGLSTILHSSGRIYSAYILEADRTLQLVYSNTDRTQFNYVTIDSNLYGLECVLLELSDQNIVLIASVSGKSPYAYILDQSGNIMSKVLMPNAFKGVYGTALLQRNDDYLLMFSKSATTVKPIIGGRYTDVESKQYTLSVVGEGTNAEAGFRYHQSSAILPMGNGQPVAIEKGLTVTWPNAVYFDGQEFYFTAYRASYASGGCELKSIPSVGTTITTADITYTFVDALDPSIPYQVKIDHLSSEITMENLNCAVNAGTYENSGAGFRYSEGTLVNPYLTAERRGSTAKVILTARNSGNITYPLTCSNNSIAVSAINGGADPSISAVTALDSCKTMTSTTTNFKNFTTPADIIIQGVVATKNKKQYAFCKLPDGRIMLTFDCLTGGTTAATAVTNIFYAISVDGGYTFSAAQAITGYNAPREVASIARIAAKSNNAAILTYGVSVGCLWLNQGGGNVFNVDLIRRRAYVSTNGAGNASALPVTICEIDIDEWKVLRIWDASSYPALPDWMSRDLLSAGVLFPEWGASRSDGKYVCLGTDSMKRQWEIRLKVVTVLDVIKNQFKSLFFEKYVKSGDSNCAFLKNVDLLSSKIKGACYAYIYRVHADEEKLWVVVGDDDDNKRRELGYIDLQEVFDDSVSRYTANIVYDLTSEAVPSRTEVEFNKEDNVWIFNLGYCIKIVDAASFGTLYEVNANNIANFPQNGLFQVKYRSGKIYGVANNTENEARYSGIQGLCIIELAGMRISYHRPGVAFPDNYSTYVFRSPEPISDNRVLGVVGNFALTSARFWSSLAVFDEIAQTWTIINSSNTKGFHDLYTNSYFTYDEATGLIYTTAKVKSHNAWGTIGFQLVSTEGSIDRICYRNIGIEGDDISFLEPKVLVKGNAETNGTPLIDPDDGALYCFWQRKAGATQKIFYDKEVVPLNLSKYLLRGSAITITKTIDASPNSLNFSLANGHLFDTTNTASTMSNYFQKGKKIEIKIGEKINGIEVYPELPDVYVIIKTSLSYKRGQYPALNVECADRRYLLEQLNVVASEYYSYIAPHTVMESVLKNYCCAADKNIRIGAVDEPGAYITGQFIDQNALQALNEIAERFGYFLYVDLGDVITIKKIDTTKPTNHIYAGTTWMVDYTPDDSFTDFTNKITVTGESPEKIVVNMPEELALTDSGTMGWWKRRKTKRLYYSEDEQKIYTNPRLVKVETASSIGFKLAGQVKEYISSPATTNTYVDVTIETPNIVPIFIAALSMILAAKSFPPTMTGGQSKFAAYMECMGTWLAFQCVGAIANYQYEIYAQPVGYIRRSFQHSATDDDLIKQLNNTIIEKKLDNPYCYTQLQCEKVADFEMMVTRAQRRRLKLTKIMHLQDEVSDIIQVSHPYNSLKQRIFITDITREILIPHIGAEGYCLDKIEGWKL